MATVQNNMLLQGIRGMFGGSIVFKNLRGKTIMAKRPEVPIVQSDKQRANRSKFKDASCWAQQVIKDPERKEYYTKKAKKLLLPNAYTAAITDCMRKSNVVKNNASKEGTSWCVNKRQFTLKKVEVFANIDGVPQARVVTKNAYDDEWFFKLTKEDQLREVFVHITDEADNVSLVRINNH